MYNALRAANGYTSNIEFNEDIYYTNEQMIQNGTIRPVLHIVKQQVQE
jgi:hypothetical protein